MLYRVGICHEQRESAISIHMGFPGGASGKESTCQGRRCKRRGLDPWVEEIFRRRKWQPAPVFLPGKFHGQKSQMGYSPWGHEEWQVTERLSNSNKTIGNKKGLSGVF